MQSKSVVLRRLEEIEVEIPALKPIFQKIRASQNKVIPLDVVAFGFEREEVIFLEQNGILLEDGGQYYMPEIFRLGFGYKLDRGARPKSLNASASVRPKIAASHTRICKGQSSSASPG